MEYAQTNFSTDETVKCLRFETKLKTNASLSHEVEKPMLLQKSFSHWRRWNITSKKSPWLWRKCTVENTLNKSNPKLKQQRALCFWQEDKMDSSLSWIDFDFPFYVPELQSLSLCTITVFSLSWKVEVKIQQEGMRKSLIVSAVGEKLDVRY